MAGKSLNKVTLSGNLTRDPELNYTPSGTAVAKFGLATNRSWTSATGENKEEVQYHNIIAWQKLAELVAKLLTKGKKIYCEGRLAYRSYTDKNGVEKSITEITIDDFIMLDGGPRTTTTSSTSEKNTETEIPTPDPESESETISDDDIPF